MKLRGISVVYRKELKDILRDKRTVRSMIIFPVVFIPTLMLIMGGVMNFQVKRLTEKRQAVVWIESDASEPVRRAIGSVDGLEFITGIADTAAALDMLREREVEAVVRIPGGFAGTLDATLRGDNGALLPQVDLYSDGTRDKSGIARKRVATALELYRSEVVNRALHDRGVSKHITQPFQIRQIDVAGPEQMGRMFTALMLPYFMILMVMAGGMYAAIDLTAGEKERGTLETLLVSGVSRLHLVLGKYLTVLTASLVTASLVLTSFTLTSAYGERYFGLADVGMRFDIGVGDVVLLLLTMTPLAAIFSALLMTLSLFAKSYKEAQSYVTPLMIVIVLPAMASAMPDLELSLGLALLPVVNVSLGLKGALTGALDYSLLVVSMATNLLLAAAALNLTLRMFQREKVLFRT